MVSQQLVPPREVATFTIHKVDLTARLVNTQCHIIIAPEVK